jgi:hypothetical protein
VLLTYVVWSAVPFQDVVDDGRKPVPLKVRVKALPPAVVDVGEMELKTGRGLLGCGGARTLLCTR